MPEAFSALRWMTGFCSMANPKRVQALLALADEDLGAARILVKFSTRTARYHVQQSAEKAVTGDAATKAQAAAHNARAPKNSTRSCA